MKQHQQSERKNLKAMRIILDDSFNKSVCLDLESFLIRMFAGDAKLDVINGNGGLLDRDYYHRKHYKPKFDEIFEELREMGAFARTLHQITNSDMFKLSPFKELNREQTIAVNAIIESLLDVVNTGQSSEFVVRGRPGTGKTVVAIYLLKLLRDIAEFRVDDEFDDDSIHAEFFTPAQSALVQGLRIGFVIPQQSLRASVQKVFAKTPGLSKDMVLSLLEVAEADGMFDLLVVDEAHRLGLRASQSSGPANIRVAKITENLFGSDDKSKTQLDWIRAKSRHRLLLLDEGQSVRNSDISAETVAEVLAAADARGRIFELSTQMRLDAPEEYVEYVRDALTGKSIERRDFGPYDLRFYDELGAMAAAIEEKEKSDSLARLVAGYAWKWRSKNDKDAIDIDEPGLRRQWNKADVDWINSPTSANEVGSIHTVQGYDLNYAGVIIGRDIRMDPLTHRVYFDRSNYFDTKAKQNNRMLGITYSDDDLLRYVINAYVVLMTRGIKGTYVYVCDETLREHLRRLF